MPPLDPDRQALAAELVEDVQRPECLPVIGAAMSEVVAPDMVAMLRPQPDTRPVVHPVGQRAGVRSAGDSRLDRRHRRQNRLHRAGIALGEWILRELECQAPLRAAQRRNLLQPARGEDPDRTMEEALQHNTTPQSPGLPPASPGNHRSDGPEPSHALALEPDHSGGADHGSGTALPVARTGAASPPATTVAASSSPPQSGSPKPSGPVCES